MKKVDLICRLTVLERSRKPQDAEPHSRNQHEPPRYGENRLKNEKLFLCYAEHAELAQRVESWRSVVHDLSTE